MKTDSTHTANGAWQAPLIDPFGRKIEYLRVSVTDRCNLRCTYCMPERMQFFPRKQLLSIEELERLIRVFIKRGVKKIRLTGGEPLVRKGVDILIRRLGKQITAGALEELTITTNGALLSKHARFLAQAGVKRINVSLDTLDPSVFTELTRRSILKDVIGGIDAALSEGIAVKINVVALKNYNINEIPDIIKWAHNKGADVSLIEVMPMGAIDQDRSDQYIPLSAVREKLEERWTLTALTYRTGGPSRYVKVEETGGRLGFITPLTQNFCDGCNRVRLTCTGKLYMCLGQDNATDFHGLLRRGASDETIDDAISEAITRKPKGHDFMIKPSCSTPSVSRQMSVTGG